MGVVTLYVVTPTSWPDQLKSACYGPGAYDVTLKLRQSSMWRRLAARHFTVDAKRIREWCSQKEQLVEGSSSSNDWCPQRLVNVMASYNALHFIPLTSDCCYP